MCELEKSIGYTFNNKDLLTTAMLHRSYANEHRNEEKRSNERLEFLGDAVLQLAVSLYLFENNKNMSEGQLSKLRASIVCEDSLFNCASKFKLGEYVKMSKGTKISGGNNNPAIISDAMEALIGAICLDGGFEKAREFINRFILDNYDENINFFDSKSELQERLAAIAMDPPEYHLIEETGPDHDKSFTVEVSSGNEFLGKGTGHSKKRAEMAAATNALKSFAGIHK